MLEHSQLFPATMDLIPISRRPTTLPDDTVRTVLERPLPPVIAHSRIPSGEDRSRPVASIVVVTYDNLVFTRMCLESVLSSMTGDKVELIVVDNGSSDGTVEYLEQLASEFAEVRVILNDRNHGFAAANNQGIATATADVLVLLNNDTLTPPGWLPRLLRHLDDPSIGLAGPVTNRSGSESEIDVPYSTYGGLLKFSEERYRACRGDQHVVQSLVMFCVALRREIWETVGILDERFEVGMFEDDDYAMRVRQAGYRIVCAEDVFVHHFGQASIGKLSASGEFGSLFHANRRRWEAKWGRSWTPHPLRPNPAYRSLVERVRSVVESTIPTDALVAVVSKGDDELLDLDVRRAWHFPSSVDGTYAGYYPRDDNEAIAQLNVLRKQGAGYLILPETAFWWLDHYPAFGEYLEIQCRQLSDEPDTCAVFALPGRSVGSVAMIEEFADA
jgi:GT2 family glycosyltransferase